MHLTTAVIAGLGMAVLTGLSVQPKLDARQVALLVPPWVDLAALRAATSGLAILDQHWAGHLLILATSDDPLAVRRLQDGGYWLFDIAGTGLCHAAGKDLI